MPTEVKNRRYPRQELKPGRAVVLQGSEKSDCYVCKVIGLGGIFVEGEAALPKGTVVRFTLELGAERIRGLATVKNTTERGIGLAFSALKPEDRAKIQLFLNKRTAPAPNGTAA